MLASPTLQVEGGCVLRKGVRLLPPGPAHQAALACSGFGIPVLWILNTCGIWGVRVCDQAGAGWAVPFSCWEMPTSVFQHCTSQSLTELQCTVDLAEDSPAQGAKRWPGAQEPGPYFLSCSRILKQEETQRLIIQVGL